MSYDETAERITKQQEERKKEQLELELYRLVMNLSVEEQNMYLSKSFKRRLRRGKCTRRNVELPEYFRKEDIPSFLVKKIENPTTDLFQS
ncbi:hypothetical protein M3226_25080 [Neobacillus cucumis]|uniref:hypothetical protein n=1 Tax=Neobacillus cucumis TaxID=1740721 RepID=UPI00203EBA50|nr:hypothetical protein [Neobacillus cucumis]MCM3728919.1 hypothetical protein [Neobacillus cucumis]